MDINAFGHSGPWTERPGFDQNAQVATGFAAKEGKPGKPRFSPVFYLGDLMAGYFAPAGMMASIATPVNRRRILPCKDLTRTQRDVGAGAGVS